MKKISVVVTVCLMLLTGHLFAQNTNIEITDQQTPMVMWISTNKTTNFVFPYAIKSVDKGSKEVLVQKANDVENVLQVKAAKPGFVETNLTVITSDGQLYSFTLKYADQPPVMNIRFDAKRVEKPAVLFSAKNDNEVAVNRTADIVATKERMINNRKDSKFSIAIRLGGLYIENDVFYFQIELENHSNINYTIDQLRFFIHDLKKSKRTASQEIELTPVQVVGNNKVINANSKQIVVVAIPKFTIPDQKELVIQLLEAQGGRHLLINLKNNQLVASKHL
ncbi:conjugative transposon protein TraN [Pedobacter sp.]|jgi:conjugative transposon TraN protein|uniref:conjugative transposon protein TraN n=1 Tax=Pedobacter sp. TaxID=1411316 RepID=UPI002CC823D5|nr:conjugative transposon protein TraN [Pedobacter sp.]HWW43124.1 conjugative transposon protein TraN [Pedobacter sp.]